MGSEFADFWPNRLTQSWLEILFVLANLHVCMLRVKRRLFYFITTTARLLAVSYLKL
jgi:hypothetical protein